LINRNAKWQQAIEAGCIPVLFRQCERLAIEYAQFVLDNLVFILTLLIFIELIASVRLSFSDCN